MNDIPTPRTDALHTLHDADAAEVWQLARTLERELALASAKVAEGEAAMKKAAEALREADIALDCTNEFLWREVYEDAQNGPDSPPEPANVIAAEAASHCRDNQRVRELIRAARTQETTQ